MAPHLQAQVDGGEAAESLVGVGAGAGTQARCQAYEEKPVRAPSWVKAAAIAAGSGLLLAAAAGIAPRTLRSARAPKPEGGRLGLWAAPLSTGMAGPSLFCWLVMRSQGYEHEIMIEQYQRRAGVFGCDDQMVLSDAVVRFGGDVLTTNIGALTSTMGGAGPLATGSWVNTESFFRAWHALRDSRAYEGHDFVVKTDPDTVFLPSVLRQQLAQKGVNSVQKTFFFNCPQVDNGFYGAIEVSSVAAFQEFMASMDRCKATLPFTGWGEDLFTQKCMTSVGVQGLGAYDLVSDGCCHGSGSAPVCAPGRAAYHPFKSAAAWVACLEQVEGQSGPAPAGVEPWAARGGAPEFDDFGANGMLPDGRHRFPVELLEPRAGEASSSHSGWLPGVHRRK